MNKQTPITIDAKGKSLGRIATEAAKILRGKNNVLFERYAKPEAKVAIINASQIKITDKKLRAKNYQRYSGYPGGLKSETAGRLASRKGFHEMVRLAVFGMIPNNKLRRDIMKNLTIKD